MKKTNNKKIKYRKAVFGVAYSKNKDGKIEYIILKRKKHWKGWEFPKGGIERGEKIIDAVKREVREETGLKCINIKKLNFSGKFICFWCLCIMCRNIINANKYFIGIWFGSRLFCFFKIKS